jgi:hypothetical protein
LETFSSSRGAHGVLALPFWGFGDLGNTPYTRGRMQRIAPLLCCLALALTGCAYHLGPTNGVVAQEKTIQVNPFANHTLEPHLTDEVTTQLRKQLQRDGTYHLATHGEADIIVSGVITNYSRQALSFQPQDTLTVQDYRVSLTAIVTARERMSGKVLLDQPVTGYTLMRVNSILPESERQSRPLLAESLAKSITALLVDGSW